MLQTTFTIPRAGVKSLNELLDQINQYFETYVVGLDHQEELYGPDLESFKIDVTRSNTGRKEDDMYNVRISYIGQDKDVKKENKKPGPA